MARLRRQSIGKETAVFCLRFPGINGAIYVAVGFDDPPPSGWAVISDRAGKRGDGRRITLCRSGISARLRQLWIRVLTRRWRGVRVLKGTPYRD